MTAKKSERHSCNYNRSLCPTKHDQIIADYERGTRWAGWLLFAMFMFMAFGSAVFGW